MSKEKANNDEKLEVRINKWDASAVKHALDDSVKNALLERPNCKQRFGLIDGRLFICALAVAIALTALGWDFYMPFPKSKPVLIICVLSYFVLMGVLTLYSAYIEKGIFVVAEQKDGSNKRVWKASSDMKKYDDKYILTLSVKDTKSSREATITKSCASFIDANGLILDNLVSNEIGRMYHSLCAEKKDK